MINLPESELKVMNYIWNNDDVSAKEVAEYMLITYEWKKNTTYTVLNKLDKKGVIERVEPNYICKPLITKEMVRQSETKKLLKSFYDGSLSALFSSLMNNEKLSKKELDDIKLMIDRAREVK